MRAHRLSLYLYPVSLYIGYVQQQFYAIVAFCIACFQALNVWNSNRGFVPFSPTPPSPPQPERHHFNLKIKLFSIEIEILYGWQLHQQQLQQQQAVQQP